MNNKLWIAGRIFPDDKQGRQWEILGLYSTREAALARCRTPHDFAGPMALDCDCPEEPTEWEGCEWPIDAAAQES